MIKRTGCAIALLLAACASAPTNEPSAATGREKANIGVDQLGNTVALDLSHETVIVEQVYNATRARVWQAVLAAHDAVGFPAVSMDANAGVASYSATNLSHTLMGKSMSSLLDCGSTATGPRADTYRIAIRIVEIVDTLDGSRTRLRTGVSASARQGAVTANALHCDSTGMLETMIGGMVTTRVTTN